MAVDAGEPLQRRCGQIAADQDEFGADDSRQRKHQHMMDNGKHKVGGIHARSLGLTAPARS
ncbi:hypothetical protein [Mesorhizobium sp. M0293]|uniref:hypothetical protein n=1 Tax=Mesorhizobium sp. M0293 TaxID=2956930 RepID=UPI00333A1AF7